MEFKPEDLLTVEELKVLISTPLPNVRAEILASKLKKYCFILEDEEKSIFYRIENNLTYKEYRKEINDKIQLITSLLIEKSWLSLSEDNRKNLRKEDNKKPVKITIYNNSEFKQYNIQLKSLLTIHRTDPRMQSIDNTPGEIHFNNGYFNLKTCKLEQRVFGKHYITKFIKRDYKPSSKEQRERILNDIRKIYYNKDDMDAILLIMGSVLSGQSHLDQSSLMLIGDGSNGKSAIMEMILACLEIYVFEMSSDTFAIGNSKRDKILNSLLKNPQYLYIWLNEFTDKRIEEATMKEFVDGKAKTTSLYSDGQNILKHNTKIIGTMNTLMNFMTDGGMTRRIDVFTHTAKFVKTKEEVDENNHVYLYNKNLIKDIIDMDLLNAFFDILADYCYRWMNGEQVKYTKNFKESKSLLVGSNDKIQDFIDGHLEITNSDSDRIGKTCMREYLLKMYPDKHYTESQIITLLKQKKLQYSCDHRVNGIKGCFVGVKYVSSKETKHIDDNLDESQFPQPITTVSLEKYNELLAKYNELEKNYNELKNQKGKGNIIQKQPKEKSKIHKIVVETKKLKIPEVPEELQKQYDEFDVMKTVFE